MKTSALSFLFVLLSAAGLSAVTPQTLELNASGRISITTDTFDSEALQIRTGVVSTAGKLWSFLPSTSKIVPESGDEVGRVGTYEFPDASKLVHTVRVKIVGSDVVVDASWPTTSAAAGFSTVDLWVSGDEAGDLTIEADGQTVFTNSRFDKQPYIKNAGEIVFKRTSTGKFLFKITGDLMSEHVVFLSEQPEQGLTFRIFNVPDGNASTIGDTTTLNWTLSFKE